MKPLAPCKHLDYAEGKYGPDIAGSGVLTGLLEANKMMGLSRSSPNEALYDCGPGAWQPAGVRLRRSSPARTHKGLFSWNVTI